LSEEKSSVYHVAEGGRPL